MFKFFKKIFAVTFIFSFIFLSQTTVFADNLLNFYTQDNAGVIDSQTKKYIKNINVQYGNTKEKPEIIVETLDTLNGDSIENYATKEFEKLKIGNKEEDNGILIVVAVDDREFRIEVGYGLEGAITDIEASDILENSTDFFKAEDYSGGVKNIFTEIATKINNEYGYDIKDMETSKSGDKTAISQSPLKSLAIGIFIVVNIILMIIFPGYRRFIFLIAMSSRRGGGSGGGPSGGRGSGGGGSGGGGSSGGW